MKLETTIKPRKDGTVNVEIGKTKLAFAADEEGRLVADVENEAVIAQLLNTGSFIPVNDEDFEAAAVIAGPAEEEAEDGDDEDIEESAPPLEENTPPSGRKPRKVK